MADDWKAAMIVIVCGIIGILCAIMVQMMDTDQILINSFVGGSITLRAVQAFLIIFWVVIGVVLAAITQ